MPDHVRVTKRTKEAAESRQVLVRREQSPTFQAVYANNVQISVSFYDFKILFGEVVGVGDESISVMDRVSVSMSPEQAQSVHRMLEAQLATYRQRFGDIRPDPETQAG